MFRIGRVFLSCGNRRKMKSNPTKLTSLKCDDMYREVFAHENVRKQFLSDVLELPLESIRMARLVTPHLWKRYRSQKQGILDSAFQRGEYGGTGYVGGKE